VLAYAVAHRTIYGVTGVPFVSGDRVVVGAHPDETLVQLLDQRNARPRRSRDAN